MKQKHKEENFIREKYEKLRREKKKLTREMANRRQEASNAHKKRSKKNLARHDSDGRFKKNLARLSGKDGHDGKLLNQLNGRFKQLETKLEKINTVKVRKQGITIFNEHSKKHFFYYSKPIILALGKDRPLFVPELSIQRESRIALIGANGTGKTTLLNHIYKHLQIDNNKALFIPQEISQAKAHETKKLFQELNNYEKGRILSEIERLGSSADSFIDSMELSPGETKKLLFALGFSRKVPLIIMDEPTNHLDINSIESLEKALEASNCAILFVSHDQKFIDNLHKNLWEIKLDKEKATLVKKL